MVCLKKHMKCSLGISSLVSPLSEAEKITTVPIYPQTQTLVCIIIHDIEHFFVYILVISLCELLVVTLFSYRGHMTLGST